MVYNKSNNKRIAKNTIFLYIRMLLTMVVSLYTSRVVLSTLGVNDFGLYNVVGGVVTMFAFLNGTLSGATQRFISFELGSGDIERLKKVFNTAMCIHWLVAVIIFILAETIGLWFVYNKLVIPPERLTAAIWVFQFSILSTMVLVISLPYNACIISHERMSVFAYISIAEVLMKLLIVYLLMFTEYDKLILYSILLFLIQLILRVIYVIYSKKHFEETHYKLILDRNLALQMLGFTGWSFFGGLATVGMGQGLNMLLNIFFGPVVNAARAIAQQVENTLYGFVLNFQTAMNPQIIKNYATNDFKSMHDLIFASCRYSYYMLFLIALPIILETPIILSVWLEEVPEHTISFLRITMFIGLANTIATPLMTAANASGRIKMYQIVVGSLLLLIVPISYIALHLGASAESILWIYFVIILFAQCVRLLIVRKLVYLSVRKFLVFVLLPIVKVTLVSAIVPLIFYHYLENDIYSVLTICLVSLLSVITTIFCIGITKIERQFVISKIKKIIKR